MTQTDYDIIHCTRIQCQVITTAAVLRKTCWKAKSQLIGLSSKVSLHHHYRQKIKLGTVQSDFMVKFYQPKLRILLWRLNYSPYCVNNNHKTGKLTRCVTEIFLRGADGGVKCGTLPLRISLGHKNLIQWIFSTRPWHLIPTTGKTFICVSPLGTCLKLTHFKIQ